MCIFTCPNQFVFHNPGVPQGQVLLSNPPSSKQVSGTYVLSNQ